MKKSILFLSFVIILCSVTYANVLLNETFEDGNYNTYVTWKNQTGVLKMNTSKPHNGSYALADGVPGTQEYYTVNLWNGTNIDLNISLFMYIPTRATTDTYLGIKNDTNNNSVFTAILVFGYPLDNKIGYLDQTNTYQDTGVVYLLDQYSKVNLIYNGTSKRITQVYYNDVLLSTTGFLKLEQLFGLYFYDQKSILLDDVVIEDYQIPASVPSLTINHNMINSTINWSYLPITYNGSFSYVSGTIVNCTLYNKTNVLNTTKNVNITTTQIWNIPLFNKTGNYYLKITCNNSEVNSATSEYNYYIDTILPTINICSAFTNNSNYNLLDTIITCFNFSDINLFAYNVSFFSPLGVLTENYFLQNITDTYKQNSSSRTAIALGYNYSILVQVWDSHTLNVISEYPIKNISNGVEIANIKFYSSDINTILPVKTIDSYNFDVKYLDTKTTKKVMYVESNTPLTIIKSKYKGHIVDFYKNKWIDFESKDITDITLNQLSSNKIEVTYTIKPLTEITIESIGDLNYYEQRYFYNIISSTSSVSINLTALENLTNAQLQETKKLNEAVYMIAYIGLIALFIFLGMYIHFAFWYLVSAIFWYLAVTKTISGNFLTDFPYIILFVLLGIIFIFGAFIMSVKQAEKNRKKDMYEKFYE